MKQAIHQSYRDLLSEICAEERERAAKDFLTEFADSLYFPRQKKIRGFHVERKYLIWGLALGVITAFLACFVRLAATNAATKKELSQIVEQKQNAVPLNGATDNTLSNEVSLIKKILAGLVESVQELSVQRISHDAEDTSVLSENFPYPVRVNLEKANLRNAPNISGTVLATVPRNTMLLATSSQAAWLKVTTPKGEDAFVNRNLVTAVSE